MFPLTNHDILSTLLAFRTIEPAPPAPAKASATRGHLPGPRWRSLCRICRFFKGNQKTCCGFILFIPQKWYTKMDSSWFFLECLSAPNLGNLRVDLFTKKGDWTTSHVESDSTRTWILPTKHPVKTETVDVSSHLTHSEWTLKFDLPICVLIKQRLTFIWPLNMWK